MGKQYCFISILLTGSPKCYERLEISLLSRWTFAIRWLCYLIVIHRYWSFINRRVGSLIVSRYFLKFTPELKFIEAVNISVFMHSNYPKERLSFWEQHLILFGILRALDHLLNIVIIIRKIWMASKMNYFNCRMDSIVFCHKNNWLFGRYSHFLMPFGAQTKRKVGWLL